MIHLGFKLFPGPSPICAASKLNSLEAQKMESKRDYVESQHVSVGLLDKKPRALRSQKSLAADVLFQEGSVRIV